MEPPPGAPGLRSVRVLRQLEHIEQAGFLPGPLLESVETDWDADE
jgi:hypothetical protein